MTEIIPLADAKARLSAVLDEVRDTHDRVVITRNGRPEAVIISVADLETSKRRSICSPRPAPWMKSAPQNPKSPTVKPSALTSSGA